MAKTRLIDILPNNPDSVVLVCLHCGYEIKKKEFTPARCPHCGRDPDPPLAFLAELADQGKLRSYLKD